MILRWWDYDYLLDVYCGYPGHRLDSRSGNFVEVKMLWIREHIALEVVVGVALGLLALAVICSCALELAG